MNRRTFSQRMLAALPAAWSGFASAENATISAFTSATRYIDADHPSIRSAVETAVGGLAQPKQRAIRIHDFVRDRVRFGWASNFYDQPASKVLHTEVGYCNTKSTLFVAMLRAAGIPARQHFVDIHASILFPFINPGTPYVDHSYTEVFLDGQWVSVDSYIVDKPLFLAAKRKLILESKALGFGIHADGVCDWDGKSNSFSQFVKTGRYAELSTIDYGIFDDVGAFYESGNGVNRLNVIVRLAFGILARRANQRIETVRNTESQKTL